MARIRNFVLVLLAAQMWNLRVAAQSGPGEVLSLEALAHRLDQLEQQNAELREQIQSLQAKLQTANPTGGEEVPASRVEALEEQMQLQTGRLAEQDQIKVEGSHRTPIRITGMVLVNAFYNGRHGQGVDYPTIARVTADRTRAGATLAQSTIGLEFHSPDAILGGRFRGSFLLDMASGDGTTLNMQARLRTASIEGQWKTRGLLVGQEKPIFAPREPNSLARVSVSPLTSAGNLWMWRPQVRFEQRIPLGSAQELRAQIGVSQTREDLGVIPAQFLASLEPKRPALEGNFRFTHRFSEFRRIEIAPGFHSSTTHVAGASIPSDVLSMDWFWNPVRQLEFTGAAFTGKNLANLGGLANSQGFAILAAPGPGEIRVIPVRGRGGWAQLTWLAASRLTVNAFSGQHDANSRDLVGPSIVHKNLANGINLFYRIAPNVVSGIEVSQVRTWYLGGQRPLNNHYDLYLGYLF